MAPGGTLVIGATGRVGRILVAELVERGEATHALVRDPDAAREMLGPDVVLHGGDLRDPGSIIGSVAGCRQIAFVAGSNGIAGRGSPREIEYEAVAALAAALRPGDIDRFVLLSSAGVTQPEHPHNCTFNSVLTWKLRGEEVLRRSGLPYTIVRALGLRDRPGGAQGIRIVQGDRIAFGEDIARGDLALFLADLLAPNARLDPALAASMGGATVEVFNDGRLAGGQWRHARAELSPDPAPATAKRNG